MVKTTLKQLLRVGIILLAISFLTRSVGCMNRFLCDLAGLGLLAAFGLTYLLDGSTRGEGSSPSAKPPAGRNDGDGCGLGSKMLAGEGAPETRRYLPAIGLTLLFVASSVLVLALDGVAALLGVAVFLCGLDIFLRRRIRAQREIPALLLTVVIYALFIVLYDYIPQVWYFLQRFSLLFSRAIGYAIRRDISLGITYTGLLMVALFAAYYLSAFILSERRKPLALLGMLLLLLAADGVYIILWAFLARMPQAHGVNYLVQQVYRVDFRLLLFVLLLLLAFLYIYQAPTRYVPLWEKPRRTKSAVFAAGLLILALLLLAVILPCGARRGEIVLYGRGSLDWSLPSFGRYGLKEVGMFGLLPQYLRERGYAVRLEDEITPATLEGASTLVLINLSRGFDPEAKQAIWDFVAEGGSMLALGDHTGVAQIREPFNDLLQPVNIAFNFDSAIPFQQLWERSYEMRPHPMLHGIGEEEVMINIGASLQVSAPSRPVIIGRYGYSDAGDPLNPQGGYLGDMTFARDEPLGDLVLAAECSYGKGKVLVFGDTSSFQNTALAHSYRFIDNVFEWLAGGNNGYYPWNIILALTLLAMALILLLAGLELNTISLVALAALLALVAVVAPALSAVRVDDHGRLAGEVANIDVSHIERCKQDGTSLESVDGLVANLIRNGYTPFLLREFELERIREGQVLVVVAPAKPFSGSEINDIEVWVSGGGLLLVTVGWEEFAAATSLLKAFGMGIENVPLGRITPEQNARRVSLWEAWPVACEVAGGVEILVEAWDYPVVVYRKYGRGGVLVAGDSSFLLNRNLETVDAGNEPNILFLKYCLERFREGLL